MKSKEYKELFEGKFTKTFVYKMNILEKIYYHFSPSTFNERLLFSEVSKHTNGSKNAILDIGCGGGHYQLVKYGKVYGIDISAASLKKAKKIYHQVIEADVSKKIPFPSKKFDVIFSSEVFGHIDKKDKDRFLKEVVRVLKDDGVIFFTIETLGNNVLTNLLKKKKLYQKYWIDYQGHIGLESPRQTRKRFLENFSVLSAQVTSSHLLPVDGYLIFSDRLPILNIFKFHLLRRTINMLIFPLFYLIIKLSDFDSGNDVIIVAKKK